MKNLSPVTVYYLRKILQQKAGFSKYIVSKNKSAIQPDLDLDSFLNNLKLNTSDIDAKKDRLEVLIQWHKQMSERDVPDPNILHELERQILAVFV